MAMLFMTGRGPAKQGASMRQRISSKRSLHNHHHSKKFRLPAPIKIGHHSFELDKDYNAFEKVYFTLSEPHFSGLARFMSFFILSAILTSTLFFVLESEPQFKRWPSDCEFMTNITKIKQLQAENYDFDDCRPTTVMWFQYIEISCMALFTLEYLLRVVSVGFCRNWENVEELGMDRKHNEFFPKRLIYFLLDGMNIVDLVAILPFYITLGSPGGGDSFSVVKTIRLARVFRVFKLSKYSEMSMLVFRVLQKSKQALSMLAFVSLLAMVVFGSMVYFAEQGEWHPPTEENSMGVYMRLNPSHSALEPTPFRTIASSFWWALVTCTTVGYGDYVPTSTMGKFVGVMAMMGGLLLIALPVTIIGANFAADYKGGKLSKEFIFMDSDSESEEEGDEVRGFVDDPAPETERSTADASPTEISSKTVQSFATNINFRKTGNSQIKKKQGEDLIRLLTYFTEQRIMKAHVLDQIVDEIMRIGKLDSSSEHPDKVEISESVVLVITLIRRAIHDKLIPLDTDVAFKLQGMVLQFFGTSCLVESRRIRKGEKGVKSIVRKASSFSHKKTDGSSSPSVAVAMTSVIPGAANNTKNKPPSTTKVTPINVNNLMG